jgi:diguanylate cyclase (GGDEF)-like protein/PAS domain S-box-containing protein
VSDIPPAFGSKDSRQLALIGAVGATYFVLARLGLETTATSTQVAAVWPAGGFLLGVLLLSARRSWVSLLLAAAIAGFVAQLAADRDVAVSLGLSAANCAETLIAAALISLTQSGRFGLAGFRQVLVLTLAALVAPAVSALLGAGVLAAGLDSPYGTTWALWFLVHAVGILAITPVVLAIVDAAVRGIPRPTAARAVEVTVVLAGLAAVTLGIFTRPPGSTRLLLDFNYPILPFLLWASLRFGSRGAPFATLILWAVGGAGTISDRGPFTNPAYGETAHLLQLQAFLGLACFGVLVGGVVADELRRRQRSLTESNVRLRAEGESLRRAEERFRGLLEAAPDAIVLVDEDGTMLLVNAEAERLFGYTRGELVGKPLELLVAERDRARHAELRRGYFANPTTRPMGMGLDLRLARKDGTELPVEIRLGALETDDGVLVSAAVRDVSEQRRAEETKDRLAAMVEHTDDAVIGETQDGTITEWNRGAQRLYGFTAEEAIGQPIAMLMPPELRSEELRALARVFRGEALEQHETVRVRKDRSEVHVSLTMSPIRDRSGAIVAVSAIGRDITERKRFEGQLQHLADHDHLTGLYNRRRLDEELRREIARAQRYGNGGTVLAIDIDNFKYVNDSLGHTAGDALIAVAAEVFRSRLRETDVIARVGGDEFAVILPGIDEQQAEHVAAGLLEAIRTETRFELPRTLRNITASIGVAPFADVAGLTSEDLLVEADIAMYDAKEAGRDRLAVYSSAEGREGRMKARLTWGDRIRRALEEERFVLHAQPILSLNGDRTPRHELLLRMIGDDGELIPPGAFLSVAERMDLVQEIDRWVLRAAAGLLAREQRARGQVRLAVNLSAKSVGDPELPGVIAAELAAAGADGSGLCLEVTETAAIVNVERAKRFAGSLAELGCEFALDDFGAGFASFYYLKHLPFDYLKIDGEFIQGICASRTDQLVVKSLADIAHGLGKRTIAEFVADRSALELLRGYQIDYAQGFFVAESKPLGEIDLAQPAAVAV